MVARKFRGRTVGLPGSFDYRLGEDIDTGQRWINGQIIYCRVVDLGALPNATTKNVAHGIATIGTVVLLEGIAQAAGPTVRALPFAPDPAGTVATGIQLSISAANLVIKTAADYSTSNGYAFVWFTKG